MPRQQPKATRRVGATQAVSVVDTRDQILDWFEDEATEADRQYVIGGLARIMRRQEQAERNGNMQKVTERAVERVRQANAGVGSGATGTTRTRATPRSGKVDDAQLSHNVGADDVGAPSAGGEFDVE